MGSSSVVITTTEVVCKRYLQLLQQYFKVAALTFYRSWCHRRNKYVPSHQVKFQSCADTMAYPSAFYPLRPIRKVLLLCGGSIYLDSVQ